MYIYFDFLLSIKRICCESANKIIFKHNYHKHAIMTVLKIMKALLVNINFVISALILPKCTYILRLNNRQTIDVNIFLQLKY